MRVKFTANEVYPNLWQGSAPVEGHALKEMGFKVLVLCAKEHQPAAVRFPGVEVIHAPNDDDFSRMPTRNELQTALRAGRRVAERVAGGDKALVTCWMGKNRSGLVNAFALHFLTGKDGLWCAKQITAVREGALSNPGFQRVVVNLRSSRSPSRTLP